MKEQYDFKKQEAKWQKFWEKESIFKFDSRKSGKIFSIDTPPPTFSGKMHLGHAFSYTHEDIIARYQRMNGKNVFYPFGIDNNGLATAKLVEKANNVRFFNLERKDFIKLCQSTLKKLTPDFIADWQKIGMSCDFSKIYSTISPESQKISQEHFIELYNQDRVYQKNSPILWCPECQTAIAQAEMEDKEMPAFFNEIEFKLEAGGRIIIATTRPELLPSCVAIFVHPKDQRYKDFIGKTVIVPLFNQKVKIIADDKVDKEKGTGAVMCCTFGDTTDIEWFLKHKLPLQISLGKDGKMNKLAKEFVGLPAKIAQRKIVEKLKEKNLVKDQKRITHAVNVHERCGTEIEILPTKQWFIKYLDLKDQFLKQSIKLNWYPPYMKVRLDNWIKGLGWDWCISRQRYFGTPIPVWHCEKCGEVILADIKELPIDPIHSKPKKKCKCGSEKYIPEKDVFDTWVTSALTPQIALSLIKDKKVRDKMIPMSLRPQAHDIINFWLFYTLARSYLHLKKLPWKDVVISGFVLDPEGKKMSKSKGNIIEPQKIIDEYGTDAMRFWAAQSALGEDLRYSQDEIKIGKRTVIKIWNASKFALMHVENYSPRLTDIKYLEDEDKWILSKFYEAIEQYTNKMDKYEYSRAKEIIDNFFWKNLCDYYLEIVKSRLYNQGDNKTKRAAQFTLYNIILGSLKLYAPIAPFITENVYQDYFRKKEKIKSIHLTRLPKLEKKLYFKKTANDFELVIDAIARIRKHKSEQHLSMKADLKKVFIETKNKNKLKKYLPLISELMFVEKIELK
ncbi:MAG: valine--tRNA ligase [Patescibacteria group bacterium]|nr:valine--tRNA ligase [Patescibacteria group bacterium]